MTTGFRDERNRNYTSMVINLSAIADAKVQHVSQSDKILLQSLS